MNNINIFSHLGETSQFNLAVMLVARLAENNPTGFDKDIAELYLERLEVPKEVINKAVNYYFEIHGHQKNRKGTRVSKKNRK